MVTWFAEPGYMLEDTDLTIVVAVVVLLGSEADLLVVENGPDNVVCDIVEASPVPVLIAMPVMEERFGA